MQTQRRKAVRIRPKSPDAARVAHPVAVFTAMDGTLLDARTFEAGPNRAAIRRLLAANVPVIPMSVMTLDELAPIARELGLHQVMVIEAGGAIARWNGSDWEVEPCGPPAETVLDVVREIEDRSGASLLVYSALGEREAARISGRSGEMLQASTRRCFSEPFVIESGDLRTVEKAAASIGFSVRAGRRFLHLCRECDEGEAFTRVREELRCETAIALGGTLVDAEFLDRADIPIVIPGTDRKASAQLLARVPHARVASSPAPYGWAAAVEDALRTVEAPKRRTRRA